MDPLVFVQIAHHYFLRIANIAGYRSFLVIDDSLNRFVPSILNRIIALARVRTDSLIHILSDTTIRKLETGVLYSHGS